MVQLNLASAIKTASEVASLLLSVEIAHEAPLSTGAAPLHLDVNHEHATALHGPAK